MHLGSIQPILSDDGWRRGFIHRFHLPHPICILPVVMSLICPPQPLFGFLFFKGRLDKARFRCAQWSGESFTPYRVGKEIIGSGRETYCKAFPCLRAFRLVACSWFMLGFSQFALKLLQVQVQRMNILYGRNHKILLQYTHVMLPSLSWLWLHAHALLRCLQAGTSLCLRKGDRGGPLGAQPPPLSQLPHQSQPSWGGRGMCHVPKALWGGMQCCMILSIPTPFLR